MYDKPVIFKFISSFHSNLVLCETALQERGRKVISSLGEDLGRKGHYDVAKPLEELVTTAKRQSNERTAQSSGNLFVVATVVIEHLLVVGEGSGVDLLIKLMLVTTVVVVVATRINIHLQTC